MTVTAQDLVHLRRCVELAQEALDDGDEPFGSVLVSATGRRLFEDRNRVNDGDATRHPELAAARWAAVHLSPAERAGQGAAPRTLSAPRGRLRPPTAVPAGSDSCHS